MTHFSVGVLYNNAWREITVQFAMMRDGGIDVIELLNIIDG